MNIINFLLFWLPLGIIAVILLRLFTLEITKGEIATKTAKRSLLIVIFTLLAQIGGKTIWFYFELQKSDFGKYFLESGNNYFERSVWYMIAPVVWAFAIGAGFLIILWAIRYLLHSEMFNATDTMIIILTVLVVGSSSVLVLILGSFLLMILVHILMGIKNKSFKKLRLRITPFLLFLALVIIILNNFNFYQKFLALLRLQ